MNKLEVPLKKSKKSPFMDDFTSHIEIAIENSTLSNSFYNNE